MTGKGKFWTKNYPAEVPADVEIQKMTISQRLSENAGKWGDKIALTFFGRRIKYKELDDDINRVAVWLRQQGISRGDVVSVILPNAPQIVIMGMACSRVGAVVSYHNPRAVARELAQQFEECHPVLIVALDLIIPTVEEALGGSPMRIVGCHVNSYFPWWKKQLVRLLKPWLFKKLKKGVIPFSDLLKAEAQMKDESNWDDLMALIYTSGTTGRSKAVMISQANASSAVQIFRPWLTKKAIDGEERLLGVYPIYHVAGFSTLQNLVLWCGWDSLLIPLPTPDSIIEVVKKYHPTYFPGVATIYAKLLKDKRFGKVRLSQVKGFFSGASPFPREVVDALEEVVKDFKIFDVYGTSEATAYITTNPMQGGIYRKGTVGVPFPNTDLKIVDLENHDLEVDVGEKGVILVKGPQVSSGYYNRPEESERSFSNGWFNTGDVGYMDEDGFLTLTDRVKDLIIHSGFNVHPSEVEEVLKTHAKIDDVCVVGIPDSTTGEVVKAVIVLKDGETLSTQEIVVYCKGKLSPYKIPQIVEVVTAIERNEAGKVLKRKYR